MLRELLRLHTQQMSQRGVNAGLRDFDLADYMILSILGSDTVLPGRWEWASICECRQLVQISLYGCQPLTEGLSGGLALGADRVLYMGNSKVPDHGRRAYVEHFQSGNAIVRKLKISGGI